ncbi:hypothetical protein C8R46DRAFT_1229677 [Mycena filopes]|nr:hypothetical protein C8R46DRAFT_1229677 [Mycena filopes]
MASRTPLLREGKYPNNDDEETHTEMRVCDCDATHRKHSGKCDSRLEQLLVKLAICACLASLACTFFNISFLAIRKPSVGNSIKFSNLALPEPNSYYGLENAVHNLSAEAPAPIRNPAFFAGFVDQSAPASIPFKWNRQFTDFGTVYPTDRRFVVSASISTIFQFRVQDFGMERCSLNLSVPGPAAPSEEDSHRHLRTRAPALAETLKGRVEVWQLGLDKRLDPTALSWNTRPLRSLLLASWHLSESQEAQQLTSPEFVCASGTIMTFELACAGKAECEVDFNQPREHPATSTLFLIQSSSM